MWRISLPYFGLVCSVLLSNKDREDRQGGVGRGVLSNGSLEFETMKAKRKARAVWRAARPPEKGLYGSILRHSFLSLLFSSLPPPPFPLLDSFLSSALFVSQQPRQRVCSSPRSAVFPVGLFRGRGPEERARIGARGRGHKGAALLRASRLWQSALSPLPKNTWHAKINFNGGCPVVPSAVKPYYRSLRKIRPFPTRKLASTCSLFFFFSQDDRDSRSLDR